MRGLGVTEQANPWKGLLRRDNRWFFAKGYTPLFIKAGVRWSARASRKGLQPRLPHPSFDKKMGYTPLPGAR